MDAIFEKIIANNFSDLKGLIADVTVPVPEYLVNDLLQATLQENKSIKDCQLYIHADNRVSLDLKTTLLPWTLHVQLRLDKSVDMQVLVPQSFVDGWKIIACSEAWAHFLIFCQTELSCTAIKW